MQMAQYAAPNSTSAGSIDCKLAAVWVSYRSASQIRQDELKQIGPHYPALPKMLLSVACNRIVSFTACGMKGHYIGQPVSAFNSMSIHRKMLTEIQLQRSSIDSFERANSIWDWARI